MESDSEKTLNKILFGILALIIPVTISVDWLRHETIKCIPAAFESRDILANISSVSFLYCAIKSIKSSIKSNICGISTSVS